MKKFCARCKGRLECGAKFCPIEQKSKAFFKVKENLKEDFFGASPNVFVGRFGYPKVNVGLLAPQEIKSDKASEYDAPTKWANESYSIKNVINLRSALVNSRFNVGIKDVVKNNNKFLEIGQEIAMAKRPVDIEINLNKKPNNNLKFDAVNIPMGPSAYIKKAMLTENPKIPNAVEKVFSDVDLKAVKAIQNLTKKHFDEYDLTKLLSSGTLGVKKERKLVPTRWAITAVDDNVGKQMIEELRDYKESDCLAFFGGNMGNYYAILLFPGPFRYELFETSLSGSVYNQNNLPLFVSDYESEFGRKNYAYNTAGGYYAARLPIVKWLHQHKLKASVLALRFITNEYYCPLGVWVVREAVKKAMQQKPIGFDDKTFMLKYAEAIANKKFKFDANRFYKESKLLKEINNQRRLREFF